MTPKAVGAFLFFLVFAIHGDLRATQEPVARSTLGGAAQERISHFQAGYDPAIPTLKQVVGHDWGEEISSYPETERYLQALAGSSPRVKLVRYGQTWGGRTLHYLVIGSEDNLARLEEIQEGLRRLADPRGVAEAEATRLIETLPSVVWLGYGIHGNEISSTDAALLTAYHLLAARDDEVVRLIRENSLVLIDPLQNPDGRDRFVNYHRQTRGRWPDADPQAAERQEDWPGGRTNHYLFDMNRDWFAMTQPETRGRVQAFLEWHPQIFVDLHEMSGESTYYFAPPADPLNPEITAGQREWLERLGRNNARWFDRMRFEYFTREVFDSFYPGYGEGWPTFQGSIGMTYEQGSARGLVYRRRDDTLLHYRDAVGRHFTASLATAETAAGNRRDLLRHFYEYRTSAVEEGTREAVKEYIIVPGRDPGRAARFAALLLSQGIELKEARAAFTNPQVRDYFGGGIHSRKFPAGTLVVPLAQPAKRLVKTLLEQRVDMDKPFVEEQMRRYRERLSLQIFDVTAWSLPLLWDLECYKAERVSTGSFAVLEQPPSRPGKVVGEPAHLAYLIPWGTQAAGGALAALHRRGIRVFRASEAFTLNQVRFPRGSLIVWVQDNPSDLHRQLVETAEETGAEIYPTATGWVEEGINLGSNQVRFLRRPVVALAYKEPTSPSSAGWTRFLLERQYGYPVTVVSTQQLARADLSGYEVLILPNGSAEGYQRTFGEEGVRRLRIWVENGGTLITFGEATRWLTEEKVELLATTREYRGPRNETPEKEESPAQEEPPAHPAASQTQAEVPSLYERLIEPEKELPGSVPGAILRIRVDDQHWLGFGYENGTNVLVNSRNVFAPLKLDQGRNVGVYEDGQRLVLSGFVWKDSLELLPHKACIMVQPQGRGHVVGFAEDPNFRAFHDGLNLLFLNAVFQSQAR